jgi:hypothetical protein
MPQLAVDGVTAIREGRRIVVSPVRDPAPLFWDAVTAISIGLERHGGEMDPYSGTTAAGLLIGSAAAPTS